jgi:leader peptidase (prepilin peptidase)/N-methyltransferase
VVIEMLTALLFLACFMRQGWSWLLVARDFPLMAILMAITFIDLKHRIIPDIFNILGCAIGLGTAYWVPDLGWVDSLLGGGLGFLLFLVLGWGYERMSGKAGLGGGDVKFLAMAGTLVGPFGVLITVLVSSIVGSVVGLLWAWRQGKKNLLGVAIPYGPFLVLGLLAYHLLGKSFWMNIYGSSSIP